MKALILSGGKGTRLRPITHTSAKQLVPVANKPILFYGLEAIVAAGITDIGIVVGDTAAEIQAAVGNGDRFGAQVTYIQQSAPLGLAHAVSESHSFLGNDPFLMYLGDNLVAPEDLCGFVEHWEFTQAARILLTEVPNPQDFGVAVLDDAGKVIRLVEKSPYYISNLALVGAYIFTPKVHDIIAKLQPSARGELEITDAIQGLVDAGCNVQAASITTWWKDTGKLSDLLEANHMILDQFVAFPPFPPNSYDKVEVYGRVKVAESAILQNCVIRGPAIIGEGARIENSFVGPYTSIGDRVTLYQTEIENSIVLEDARLDTPGNRIADSLIGRDVRIHQRTSYPRVLRFMLGDHSEVTVF